MFVHWVKNTTVYIFLMIFIFHEEYKEYFHARKKEPTCVSCLLLKNRLIISHLSKNNYIVHLRQ